MNKPRFFVLVHSRRTGFQARPLSRWALAPVFEAHDLRQRFHWLVEPSWLFDPKDYISGKHGEAIDSPLDRNVTQVGTEKFLALGAMAPVKPRGLSGMMISDLMPNLAEIADDICLRGPVPII